MNTLMQGFANMPGTMKGALVGAIVLVLAGAIWLFGATTALFVVLGGLVVVGLLVLGYTGVLGMMAKRHAGPMARSIAANAATAPMGITQPARRARLDELRKNFDTGVEKFREAGKNLYALPWYLLVGEPGSGKTEAIRHCNVGFPPGLQDQLQGVGGTLNMNWWFTNHAVVLDTAGRMLFDEVEPGTTSEWQEFLKLLRKNRPNCPVNGMLLVIPAESLIKDTADALEKKAGKIAQQLDSIQRALGVRFPVFVLITKSDLINGFREFFDEITDPTLQHQIMGWTNPAPLDAPFNPDLVGEHLRTVQKRLAKRRAGLLLDPVNTEGAGKARADQVDALYAFPDAMVKVGPRLQRYLEMIFTAGEWAQKPLFLRGMYFTSSMREGAALDQELADAFGIPVESLPEGKVWERDRAYFLRDLFVSKVFREKGLVTRASSTRSQMRQRNMLLYGLGGLGLLAVAAFTLFGAMGLARTVAGPTEFWGATSAAYLGNVEEADAAHGTSEHLLPIVSRPTRSVDDPCYYRGGRVTDPNAPDPLRGVPVDAAHRSRAGMAKELAERAQAPITVPVVFKPVAAMLGDSGKSLAGEKRVEAARAIFEASVLRPLVDACKVNLATDAEKGAKWPEAAGAEAQLRLIGESIGAKDAKAPAIDFGALLRYALRGSNDFAEKKVVEDLAGIEEGYRALYVDAGVWPPESMKTGYSAIVPGGKPAPTAPVAGNTVTPPKTDPPRSVGVPNADPPRSGGVPMKFPLAAFTSAAGEMTSADVSALREEVEKAKVNGQVPAGLKKAEAMLKALPSGSSQQLCTLTILAGEPASLGKTGLVASAPFVSVVPVGGQAGKPTALAGQGEVKLTKLRAPGAAFELRFYASEAGGTPAATVTVPSAWGAMWLVDTFHGEPKRADDRRVWEVEVDAGAKGTVWVRLEFDAELPEMPWHQ